MIFRRISHRLALQFTGFVFLLLLGTGAIFLAADYNRSQQMARARLEQLAEQLMRLGSLPGDPRLLAPRFRERIRICRTDGTVQYAGSMFPDVPFNPERFSTARQFGDDYVILTLPGRLPDGSSGHLQVAEIERHTMHDLPRRLFVFAIVSASISALTYGVGLFFANRSLRPARDMVAKLEQFTQDASHELRTPLTSLQSTLELAERTKEYAPAIASARQDVLEITQLIDRLLELARLDAAHLRRERTDVTPLTRRVVERLEPTASAAGVRLETALTQEVQQSVDAALFTHVVQNLVSNAIKYTPAGGLVRVALSATELTVTDTGIGIAPEHIGNIFERFYQVDPSRSADGVGLGLALVKNICDLHGWRIGVQSQVGQGTTFVVTFA